ncbi:hypothetical protein FD754_016708, partial [Muntiacus muntjak]
KLEKFLNFKNLQTCLKEASLLDYYVSGFLWAKGMNFSVIQYSKFMTLLDMLLHNLRKLLSWKEEKKEIYHYLLPTFGHTKLILFLVSFSNCSEAGEILKTSTVWI